MHLSAKPEFCLNVQGVPVKLRKKQEPWELYGLWLLFHARSPKPGQPSPQLAECPGWPTRNVSSAWPVAPHPGVGWHSWSHPSSPARAAENALILNMGNRPKNQFTREKIPIIMSHHYSQALLYGLHALLMGQLLPVNFEQCILSS